jgi:adenosylhomocysteine nucleosidase
MDMRTILMVASEPREFSGILRRCRGVRRLGWPLWCARRGELNGSRLLLVADGAGKHAGAAAELAMREETPEAVVSVGICGALDPTLAAGDIFVPVDAAPPKAYREYRSGSLLTTDHVVGTVEEKARLWKTGAAAVEMEAASVAPVARRHGLPFYCIRAVMDRADEGFTLDFDRLLDARGRFSRARIVAAALARPARSLPELLRLERQSRRAALALGDFIADCRF